MKKKLKKKMKKFCKEYSALQNPKKKFLFAPGNYHALRRQTERQERDSFIGAKIIGYL